MKRFYLLVLLVLSLSVVGCANASSSSDVSEVCSLEIENTLSQEIKICVGQVKNLSNDENHYQWDWDSIGTISSPTENRFKFLPVSKVQSKEIIKIYGYPDEGYEFFVWASVPNISTNGFGIPKYAKKAYIYLNNGEIIVSMYPNF